MQEDGSPQSNISTLPQSINVFSLLFPFFLFFSHLFNPTNRLTKYNYSTIQIEATDSTKGEKKDFSDTMLTESKGLRASHTERIEKRKKTKDSYFLVGKEE